MPLDNDTTIITGPADLGTSGVRVQTLVATNNASLTNGTLAVENLQLLSGSTLGNATINVLTALNVAGTNCTLQNATLSILGIASGSFLPLPPAPAATLVLTQGAILNLGGLVSLSDGSQISGGGLPQSTIVIAATGEFISTNSTLVSGSTNGHLILDNSGVVRADGGTLSFSGGIDWRSSAGLGEFRANGTALILFSNVFHSDSTVTSLFTGPGTNRWLAGAGLDGQAQIGAPDPSTQLAGPGNLEILGPVSGGGLIHVLGTTNQGGTAIWSDGALGLPALSVDAGANLLLPAAAGANRQLTACVITNLGNCSMSGGVVGFALGATFDNQPGATFVVQGQGVLANADGSGVFNNAGTLQVLSPGALQFGDTNSTPGPAFNNNGLVDLRAGQLALFTGASAGEFHQAPGTLLWFWGGAYSVNAGTSFTGSNAVRIAQGAAAAECLLNQAIAVPSLELGRNGLLDATGAGAGNTNAIGSLVTHDNGVITNGTFAVQTFEMSDQSTLASSAIAVGTSLEVSATNALMAGSSLLLQPGASGVLHSSPTGAGARLNLSQGTVFQDAGQLTLSDGSLIASSGPLQNQLLIQPGGSLVCTNSATVAADLNLSGTLEVKSGTLAFQGAWEQSQGVTSLDAGALLTATNLSVLGGTITGNGTIDGILANSGGVVSPGLGSGTLSTSPGSDYQQGALASLLVELGMPGSENHPFAVGGKAQLDGQLQLRFTNGFVPVAGDTFSVLTSASQSGKFANVVAPPVAGAVWVARYNGTNVTLALISRLQLVRPIVSGGSLSFPVSTTVGTYYTVQASDSLAPPNWQTIASFSGDGTVKMVSDPIGPGARFYRVVLQ